MAKDEWVEWIKSNVLEIIILILVLVLVFRGAAPQVEEEAKEVPAVEEQPAGGEEAPAEEVAIEPEVAETPKEAPAE